MGNVEVRPMITEHYNIKDAVNAMQHAGYANAMKIIIEMD